MRNTLPYSLLALMLLVFAAAPSQAAIIDFTDADAWGDADGVNAVGFTSLTTYDGVSVTVTSASATQLMTFNQGGGFFNFGCSVLTGGFLACDGDGIGIDDDEVTFGYPDPGGEALFVDFSQPVDVTRFAVFDLFGQTNADPNAEVVQWGAITTTGFVPGSPLTGTDPDYLLGLAVGDVNLSSVISMVFFAGFTSPSNSDFALAAIEMTPSVVVDPQLATVPEPATLLLTGGGLFAAALRARRRRRA